MTVLKEERQHIILEELRINKKVLTSDLSQALDVSEDTIRRDLKDLADTGYVRRVHGGAIANHYHPQSFSEREVFALERKIMIAEKAAHLFSDNQVIIMDGGTTNLELAKRLPENLKATIFTNSLPIAMHLSGHATVDVIFTGGRLLKQEKATAGIEVIESFKGVRADLCVLGTRSIHVKEGITENNWDETRVKRAIVAASCQVVSLVIAEKLETIHPYRVADISQVNMIVGDLDIDHEFYKPYQQIGIKIM